MDSDVPIRDMLAGCEPAMQESYGSTEGQPSNLEGLHINIVEQVIKDRWLAMSIRFDLNLFYSRTNIENTAINVQITW